MKNWIKMIKNGSIMAVLMLIIASTANAAQQSIINVTEEGGSQELIVGDYGNFQVPESIIRNGETIPVQSVIYESEESEILSVDETGAFHALKPGEVSVYISVYGTLEQTDHNNYNDDNYYYDDFYNDYIDIYNNYDDNYYYNNYYYDDENSNNRIFQACYEFTIKPDLSTVTLKNTSQTAYTTSDFYQPEFTFSLISDIELNDYDSGINVSYEASNPNISIYGSLQNNVITITMDQIGSTSVTISINEKQFQVHITSILVSITKNSLLMSSKETKQLKIKGVKKGIQWSSSNPNIVKVSSSGKVKAKKNGNAIIKASIGDISLGCAVSVVSKNRQKAIKTGIRIGKNYTYSQAHRMEKNYYDCSSLVWRAYRNNGNNFGNTNYAPVAADQGKWCVRHKRLVKGGLSEKNIRIMKLHAGDLLFETGGNKNRYRGIYHVEMISGYICYGFDEKGKPILGITWANRPVDYYFHGGQMVGRP